MTEVSDDLHDHWPAGATSRSSRMTTLPSTTRYAERAGGGRIAARGRFFARQMSEAFGESHQNAAPTPQ